MNMRWFALLLVVLMPIVHGEITIDGLDDGRYNLGDEVLLSGNVQEQKVFTGSLEINSVCGNETKALFFSLVTLDAEEKYEFSQDFPLGNNVTGSCYFNVIVDGDNGEVEEKKSEEFTVTRELRVDADTDILTQKPGEDVVVSGVIRKSNGVRVGSGSVALTLMGKVYGSGLSDGAFSYKLTLPDNIGSGEQIVGIRARDLLGNEGIGEAMFRVISVPEDLSIGLDKEIYLPGDRILATVFLNDQSGKNVLGSSTVELIDSEGNNELTRVADNGNDFEIFLDEISLPGTWVLKAENKDFKASKKFYVEEVKDKEVTLEGDKLIIRNIGNVNYDEPIQLDLDGENGDEFRVIKKTSLRPNQTLIIDLNKEVPGGNYGVGVGGNLITGNVILEGSGFTNLKTSSGIGYFALVFVFLFLIFIVVSKGRKRLGGRKSVREKGREIILKRNEDGDKGDGLRKVKKEDVDYMIKKAKENVPLESDKKESNDHPFDIFN